MSDSQAARRDQAAITHAFDTVSSGNLSAMASETGLKIGGHVKAKVQLVKDYGLILQIENSGSETAMTGFIVNDQKANAEKTYKVGETLKDCVILDIDPEKKIIDLSERLAGSAA